MSSSRDSLSRARARASFGAQLELAGKPADGEGLTRSLFVRVHFEVRAERGEARADAEACCRGVHALASEGGVCMYRSCMQTCTITMTAMPMYVCACAS